MEGIFRKIGADHSDGVTQFCLWAPFAKRVRIKASGSRNDEFEMKSGKFGYWDFKTDRLKAGDKYWFLLDDNDPRPDPASKFQPDGVHGPSVIIDFSNAFVEEPRWNNPELADYCMYELHVGTFSPQGTFQGVIERIAYLKDLGINAIELMPLAAFPGERNWGYDGVYPFAVQESYGGPDGLIELVKACHHNGIAVILDVVYNHLGPEGNYLGHFGPYFSKRYKTPWGEAVNFDDAYSYGFRNYVVQNMLMWFRDFHIDGLRLDAVHSIFDFSANHIMKELTEEKNRLMKSTGNTYYLIAESNLNDARYINPLNKGGYGLDAQWSDDFHHAVHTLLTGEEKRYYIDFGKMEHLVKSYKQAFYYDGLYSSFRKKIFGNSVAENNAGQFIIFTQNHDQIGNRKYGERLSQLTGYEHLKLIAALLITSPYIPMLYMGEEYAESAPFLYFVNHTDPHLNKLVNEGRKKELGDLYGNDEGEVPDPSDIAAFNESKLKWNLKDERNAVMLGFYKELFRLRKTHPVLKVPDKNNLTVRSEGELLCVQRYKENITAHMFFNFGTKAVNSEIDENHNEKLYKILDSADEKWLGAGSDCPERINAGEKFKINPGACLIFSGLKI